ncbi:hypothetical protein AAZX31_01G117800 [Glycine max]
MGAVYDIVKSGVGVASMGHAGAGLILCLIQEEREFDELSSQDRISHSRSTPNPHPPTPIVHKHTKSKKKRSDFEKDGSVSCNKCRPHSCDKIFILPLDPIIMASGYLVYLLSTIFLPFILYALLLHKFVMKNEFRRMAKALQNQYFNEVRPLEAERFKALRIQWAQYYLKVRNQT